MPAGLTQSQIAFINSRPWVNSVRVFSGNPYIPGVIVIATLNAAFGPDGWGLVHISDGEDRIVEGSSVRVVAQTRVSIEVYPRDQDGHLIPGARPIVRCGVGTHTSKVNNKSLAGVAIDNAHAGALTRAIRSAAAMDVASAQPVQAMSRAVP